MFSNISRENISSPELSPILLTGDCHADGVFRHGDGAVTNQPVKAQTGNVQHIRGPEDNSLVLGADGLVIAPLVAVVELAPFVPVYRHLVGHEGVQRHHLTFAVADDLGIGVPPEE